MKNVLTWVVTSTISLGLLIALATGHVATGCFLSLPLTAIALVTHVVDKEV